MRTFLCVLLTFCCSLSSDEPDFETLYATLEPALEKFTTPFTVFVFNFESAKFALEVARNFPLATCILAGKDNIPEVTHYPENMVVLSKPLIVSDMKNLIQTEHFDLLVGYNTKSIKNFNFIAKALANNIVLQQGFEAPTEIIEGKTTATLKPHWFSKNKPSLELVSRNSHMLLSINPPNEPWSYNVIKPAGVSLITFLALEGSYPEISLIEEKTSSINWRYYPDLAPWDIFITGNKLEYLPYSIDSSSEEHPELFLKGLLSQSTTGALKTYLAPR